MCSNSLEIEIKKDGFTFHLNPDTKTASIFNFYGDDKYKILIPRSVTYQSQEFIVTSILKESFKSIDILKPVQFSPDSNVQTIEEYAFNFSAITSVSIPSSTTKICKGAFQCCTNLRSFYIPSDTKLQVIEKRVFYCSPIESISLPSDILELKEGWCYETSKLTNINIIQREHKNIKYYKDGIIVGKSDISSDVYDVLLFVPRSIKDVQIPSNIKIIGSSSFDQTLIEEIFIPSEVTTICSEAFARCNQLKKIETPSDSKLQKIGKKAFYCSPIESISLPSDILEFQEKWCYETSKLTNINIIQREQKNIKYYKDGIIIGKSDISSDVYDVLLFVPRSIKDVQIPSNIKIIGSSSFDQTLIEEISIPSEVTTICSGAFYFCEYLHHIEIPQDSKLQIIEDNAFIGSAIDTVFIPSNITKISKEAFKFCDNLRDVKIPQNSKLQLIEKEAFVSSSIEKIFIPQEVVLICKDAFSDCQKLQYVEMPENSKLQIIGEGAFEYTSIRSIFITSENFKIDMSPFVNCEHIQIIEIDKNYDLKLINIEGIFVTNYSLIIMIPSK